METLETFAWRFYTDFRLNLLELKMVRLYNFQLLLFRYFSFLILNDWFDWLILDTGEPRDKKKQYKLTETIDDKSEVWLKTPIIVKTAR